MEYKNLKEHYTNTMRRIKYYKNFSFLLSILGLTGIGVGQFLPKPKIPKAYTQYLETKSKIESLIEEKERIERLGLKEYGKNISSILNKEKEEKQIIADSLKKEKSFQDYLETKEKDDKKRNMIFLGGFSATLIGMFGTVYFMGLYKRKEEEEMKKLEEAVLTAE
ncbi:hypothetical protein JW949_03785 [Candidatus Woesearchaeota archaeon]|nr:hypothetical protein [Candidatus Woesearchaeota archaeon]